MESGIKMSPVSTEFPVYLTGYNFALKKSYSEGTSYRPHLALWHFFLYQ